MKIELCQWEVMEAIKEYLEREYGIDDEQFELRDLPHIEYQRAKWEPIKHKNGRIKKHPEHGHTLREIVGYETESICFNDCSSLILYIEGVR
jgi:hypothetical protein